jgi:hypothetical protein
MKSRKSPCGSPEKLLWYNSLGNVAIKYLQNINKFLTLLKYLLHLKILTIVNRKKKENIYLA